eukprot:scaffold41001_cov214-Amphora_coffeaeformis.AAC.1
MDNNVGPATEGGMPKASQTAVKQGKKRSSATTQTAHNVTAARRAGNKRLSQAIHPCAMAGRRQPTTKPMIQTFLYYRVLLVFCMMYLGKMPEEEGEQRREVQKERLALDRKV